MIKAWFVMAGVGKHKTRPTRCMNVYAKYRNELSKVMSEAQSGKKNSQYGKHWYTNLRTGESTSFFSKPDKFWVEGRNWFNREGKNLYSIVTKNILTFGAIRKRIYRSKSHRLNLCGAIPLIRVPASWVVL